jgi:hypothetical protein
MGLICFFVAIREAESEGIYPIWKYVGSRKFRPGIPGQQTGKKTAGVF